MPTKLRSAHASAAALQASIGLLLSGHQGLDGSIAQPFYAVFAHPGQGVCSAEASAMRTQFRVEGSGFRLQGFRLQAQVQAAGLWAGFRLLGREPGHGLRASNY